MISGNASISTPPPLFLQPIGNVNNITGSAFANRLVRHGFDVDAVGKRLSEMVSGDPDRAKFFREEGETSSQGLLKRLISKLNPFGQPKNSTLTGDSSALETKNVSGNAVPDGDKPKQKSPFQIDLTPISCPVSIEQGLIPDDLSPNGEFVRLGGRYPGFLLEGEDKEGVTVYRFRNRYTSALRVRSNHVELSNCFYPIAKGDDLTGSTLQDNPELAKKTGAYLNACDGLGKNYYGGEFDMQIYMRNPGNVTVFRLMPHSDGLQYLDSSNKLQKLAINSSVSDYNSLLAKGARFESSGDSPLTMRVEHRDGQHFFTVKTRSDYSTYKADGNYCDIPFTGSDTPLGEAKCCTDGENQRQDVKYIYAEPLKNGWFHVRFAVGFSEYSGANDTGLPFTAFSIDGDKGVMSLGRVGNNNHDSKSEPSGYHAQFGISDVSRGRVVVRMKNPQFEHADVENRQWPSWLALANTALQQASGECQASLLVEEEAPASGGGF